MGSSHRPHRVDRHSVTDPVGSLLVNVRHDLPDDAIRRSSHDKEE